MTHIADLGIFEFKSVLFIIWLNRDKLMRSFSSVEFKWVIKPPFLSIETFKIVYPCRYVYALCAVMYICIYTLCAYVFIILHIHVSIFVNIDIHLYIQYLKYAYKLSTLFQGVYTLIMMETYK